MSPNLIGNQNIYITTMVVLEATEKSYTTQPSELTSAVGNCRRDCQGTSHFCRQKKCQGVLVV